MLPFVFEWDWEIGRFIFMGLLYLCLSLIGAGLTLVLGKTLWDFISGIDHHHH